MVEQDTFKIVFKEKTVIVIDTHYEKANVRIAEGTVIGENVIIMSGTIIKEDCIIENNVIIGNNTLIREGVKIEKNCSIGFSNALEPKCYIGSGTRTQGFCMIGEGTTIGKNVFLGPHFNSSCDSSIGKPKGKYIPQPPIIKSGCRFGTGCKLLPGVIVEKNTIVGAMSLVNKNTEENSLYYGVPAKRQDNKSNPWVDRDIQRTDRGPY